MSASDQLGEAESLLMEAESRGYDTDGNAVASVAVAVYAINEAMKRPERDRKRLREVIEKLQKVGREVAERTGARTFSLTVGFPAGISASFEWKGRD
jgi:phage tail tape-measure protein